MKHLLITLISILLLSSPMFGQSSKYESVSQCVLQTMTEKKLTGNQMFEMVKEECERIIGKVGSREKKRKKGVLFLGEVNGEIGWVENTGRSYGKYVGEIKNGEPNGQGKMSTPDGEKVEGEWKDGVLHGKGTRTFPVGLKYVGEYKNGIRHGQGTQIHPYGWKYVGGWRDGRQHGQGTTTWSKGDLKGYRFVGEYNNGSFWNVTVYKDGNILYKYVNGETQ